MSQKASTIPALFHARVTATPDAVALQEFDAASGTLHNRCTWRAWADASTDVAGALVSWGGMRGEAVAILAANRLLWPIADVGVVMAGLVPVGIETGASVARIRAILEDCGARVVIVDTTRQLARVRRALDGFVRPPLIVAAVDESELAAANGDTGGAVTWSAWLARGRHALVDGSNVFTQVARRGAVASADDVAMLVYTAEDGGAVRGVRLPHRYVVESARSIRDTLGITAGDSSLAFLPFADVAERIFGLYTRIVCGMTATLVDDPGRVGDAGRLARPTIFGALPRWYVSLYEALLGARAACDDAGGRRWDRALELGRDRAALRHRGDALPVSLEREWRSAGDGIRAILERFFGDAVRLATSGGAALPVEVAEYLEACDVAVLGSYGRTEQFCIAFNRPERYRHDSVGLAMPGTNIRIAADGEILVRRSALTFDGYHRRPAESAAAWTDDGHWLRTGDHGTLDAEGFLRLAARGDEGGR